MNSGLREIEPMLQLSRERFELDFERRIIEIAFDQVHDGAAHHHGFHLFAKLSHVFGPRNAKAHGEWKVGYRTHRTNQRRH